MSYRAAVLADNPRAYYFLDENSGTTIVDSVGGFNGTVSGGPPFFSIAGARTDTATGIGFDNIADTQRSKVIIPTNTFDPTGDFAFEHFAFLYDISGAHNSAIVDWKHATSEPEATWATGRLLLSNGSVSAPSNASITTNVWVHAVVSYNSVAQQVSFFLNGVFDSTKALASFPTATITNMFIAGINSTASFHGVMDELAIYNHQLTLADVQEHFNAISSPYGGQYEGGPLQLNMRGGPFL